MISTLAFQIFISESKQACRIRGHLTSHGSLDEQENNNSGKKQNWSENSLLVRSQG